jgi:hypothetical protein
MNSKRAPPGAGYPCRKRNTDHAGHRHPEQNSGNGTATLFRRDQLSAERDQNWAYQRCPQPHHNPRSHQQLVVWSNGKYKGPEPKYQHACQHLCSAHQLAEQYLRQRCAQRKCQTKNREQAGTLCIAYPPLLRNRTQAARHGK